MEPIAADRLRAEARAVLETHLRPEGHTIPHASIYPWQWLWDSAFHAIAWNRLGDPGRAVRELDVSLHLATDEGFVPHVQYHGASPHAAFWGRADTSCITQPPMFGHALAELVRTGTDVPVELLERAGQALRFLLDHRRRVDGLVSVVHPWETGADDSPRWDHWCHGGFSTHRWYDVKGEIVRTIGTSPAGSPIDNPGFAAAPAGFNALVAFNALELGEVTGDGDLVDRATELAVTLDTRWDAELATWTDAGDAADTSGRIRTLDALLPVLVTRAVDARRAVFEELLDPAAFAAPFGPLGVHRAEPTFTPGSYWRGGTWPQLAYLLWVAAVRHGASQLTDALARSTARGALTSGFAEYWDGDTGAPGGAAPQSWTAVVVAMYGTGA